MVVLYILLVVISGIWLSASASFFIDKEIPFLENKGQTKGNVLYYAYGRKAIFLVKKDKSIGYVFPLPEDKFILIKEKFLNLSNKTEVLVQNPESININYVEKGINLNKSYKVVQFKDIYEGIDLLLKYERGALEKVFLIEPFRSPDVIKIEVEGIKDIYLNEEGNLILSAYFGNIVLSKPVAYQIIDNKKVYVPVEYAIKGRRVYGFKVKGNYDKSKKLIIDPLISATFIGGSYIDDIVDIKLSSDGNIYVLGSTLSADFPATPGVYDQKNNDIFIAVFTPDLKNLLISTFLGGSGVEIPVKLLLDSNDNVYVGGNTFSSDIYPGVTYQGKSDVFVAQLDKNLTTIQKFVMTGTVNEDILYDFTVDTAGNIFMTGYTERGDKDIFVIKVDTNSNITKVEVGDISNDIGTGIDVDGTGNIYVSGFTASQFFPTTSGVYDTGFNGNTDAVVLKFDANLNLLASTFVGGIDFDIATGIKIGPSGNIYITGKTASYDFPVFNGFQNSVSGSEDIFITILPPDLSSIISSTLLGGSLSDTPSDFVFDQNGDIYLTGYTNSQDFPTSQGAFQEEIKGGWDLFLSKIKGDLSQLLISTYIGGSSGDFPGGIDIDQNGNVYIGGSTFSEDFPSTVGSFSEEKIYDKDGFIIVLDKDLTPNAPPVITDFTADKTSGKAPITINFTCSAVDTDGTVVEYMFDLDGDEKFEISNKDGRVKYTYWDGGKLTVSCRVKDSTKMFAIKRINLDIQPANYPPLIESFKAEPQIGAYPLEVTFSWNVTDRDGDKLSCKLEPGDNTKPYTINDCQNANSQKHVYKRAGEYKAVLTVQDGKGHIVKKEINIYVKNEQSNNNNNNKNSQSVKRRSGGCSSATANVPLIVLLLSGIILIKNHINLRKFC